MRQTSQWKTPPLKKYLCLQMYRPRLLSLLSAFDLCGFWTNPISPAFFRKAYPCLRLKLRAGGLGRVFPAYAKASAGRHRLCTKNPRLIQGGDELSAVRVQ